MLQLFAGRAETLEYIGEFDICDVCEWEDDPLQRENPEDGDGVNELSLNEYRKLWNKQKAKAAQSGGFLLFIL